MSGNFSFHELSDRLKVLEQELDVRFEIKTNHEITVSCLDYAPKLLHTYSQWDCYEQGGDYELLWDVMMGRVDLKEFKTSSFEPIEQRDESQFSQWNGEGYNPQITQQVLDDLNQVGVLMLRHGHILSLTDEVVATYTFARCYFKVEDGKLVCYQEEEVRKEECRFDFRTHEVFHTSLELPSLRVITQQKDAKFLTDDETSSLSRLELIRFMEPHAMEYVLYETIWQHYFHFNQPLGKRKTKEWYTYLYFKHSLFQDSVSLQITDGQETQTIDAYSPSIWANETTIKTTKMCSLQSISLEDVLELFYTRCYRVKSYKNQDCSLFLKSPKEILQCHQLPVAKTTIRLLLDQWEHLSLMKRLVKIGFSVKEIELLTVNQKDYNKLFQLLDYPWVQTYIQTLGTKTFARMIYRHQGCPFAVIESIQELLEELILCVPNLFANLQDFLNLKLNLHNLEQEVLRLFGVYRHHPLLTDSFDLSRVKTCLPFEDYQIRSKDGWCFEAIDNPKLLHYFFKKYKLCLPSYVKKLQNQEVALIGIYHDEVFKGCLELDLKPNTFEVVQLKEPFNKAPNETLKEKAQLFAERFGLNIKRLA